MSNVLTGNPLIIDTAGTDIVTGQIAITKIRWVSPVVDKTITLKDKAGATKFQYVLGAGSSPTEPSVIPDSDFNPSLKMHGLTVADISSAGIVHIYLDSGVPAKTT